MVRNTRCGECGRSHPLIRVDGVFQPETNGIIDISTSTVDQAALEAALAAGDWALAASLISS